jgi:hypothetical protein
VGAHVYLLAANTTGYGGNGIAAASGNASVSVVSAAETGTSDSTGAYVTTDANGKFSLTGDYACSSGQQLYLYALGGNAGSGVNSAIGLMAVVGSCPSSSGPAISATVNEVSTIAAAYAFAGFATDATHVSSSGTALALVGIANAFANAGNLATLGTGVALATTPAGNGTVPQTEINTLANVLASCVSATNGSSSTACSTLFANAESGGLSGTVATDTATAAINIAHNPGVGVAALYGLAGAVFTPKLSAQPNDWTVALSFTGGGLDNPQSVAIDGSGNVWAANFGARSVSEFSSLGAALSPSSGYTGGGLIGSLSIAIDSSGNAWAANSWTQGVVKFSSAGVATAYTGGGSLTPISIAIDGSGNVWLASYMGASEFSSAGVALSPSTGYNGGLVRPWSIAIDGSGDAWIVDRGSLALYELSNSGKVLSPSTGYAGGGLMTGGEIAIDGSGDVWVPDYDSYPTPGLSEFSNSGTALSPSAGYTGGGLVDAVSVAIDGSGNAWVASSSNGIVSEFSNAGKALSPSTGYVFAGNGTWSIAVDGSGNVWTTNIGPLPDAVSEIIGVAVPVITPICAGLPATPTKDGSSKLGTRP